MFRFLLLASLTLPACLRVGGGARVLVDPKDGSLGVDAHGTLHAFYQGPITNHDEDVPTDEVSGAAFGLKLRGGYDPRHDAYFMSPRFGVEALGPHIIGALEFGPQLLFKDGYSDNTPPFLFTLSFGPRFEVSRSKSRKATEIAVPATVQLSTQGGFTPLVGVGVEAHRLSWPAPIDMAMR